MDFNLCGWAVQVNSTCGKLDVSLTQTLNLQPGECYYPNIIPHQSYNLTATKHNMMKPIAFLVIKEH